MAPQTHVIGIDLGGTKIEAILHDGKKVLKTARVLTEDAKGYAHVLANLETVINQVRSPSVVAIGLATPGYIASTDGILRGCPNNPALLGKPVARDLSKRVKLPVVHENDAKCFAYAEATLGADAGKEAIIGLIVGTGVGAGIVLGGHLVRGTLGTAGEVGHIAFRGHDYEHYTSGPALERLYREASELRKPSPTASEIFALKNDKAAQAALAVFYDSLAQLCALLVNTCNPDVIVCGGGVAKSIDYKRLRTETAKYALPVPMKVVKITQFSISDAAGSIGAAMLARHSVA